MKVVLMLALLSSQCLYSQTPEAPKPIPVKTDAPKGDKQFSKVLMTLLPLSGNNFQSLPMQLTSVDIIDSNFAVKLVLPGANEAKLIKSKDAITLTEAFSFGNDADGLMKVLTKIKAALPEDFVYTLKYDETTKTSDYTFFKSPASKSAYPGYPEEIHLMGNVNSAYLTIMKMR